MDKKIYKTQNTSSCDWPHESPYCSSSGNVGNKKDYSCTWTKTRWLCKLNANGTYTKTKVSSTSGLEDCGESSCISDGGSAYTCVANRSWKQCVANYSLSGEYSETGLTSCTAVTSTPCSSSSHVGKEYIIRCEQ